MPLTFDVLGIGCAAVDDLLFVESYPVSDAKARVLRSERRGGGLTATALVAAARLGARCAYGGILGDDELSRFTRDTLEDEGVDVSLSPTCEGAFPIHSTIIVDSQRGTRNIFFEVGGLTGAHESEPAAEIIQSCRVLFIDNFNLPGNLRAARLAREANIPVVADFEGGTASELSELLPLVNHLILSRDFARGLTGARTSQQVALQLWNGPGNIVAVTDGEHGCQIVAEDGSTYVQPALQVQAVDTTGCGDVFHGAYAAALAQGETMADCFLLAAVAAALKAAQPGGQRGIPRRDDIDRYLERNPQVRQQLKLTAA